MQCWLLKYAVVVLMSVYWSCEKGWSDWLEGRKRGEEHLESTAVQGRGGLRKRGEEGVGVWGMWGKEGGGEYHPLRQLWRGSGGWAAHRKQLWLHPRPHTEQPGPPSHRQTDLPNGLAGPNRRGFVYFSSFGGGGKIVQHKLFIRPLICHVSAFACGECVYISPVCV